MKKKRFSFEKMYSTMNESTNIAQNKKKYGKKSYF